MTIDPGNSLELIVIALETTLQYWPFSPGWFAEDTATFMEHLYLGQRASLGNCSLADNLSGIDAYYRERGSGSRDGGRLYYSACDYSLGYGLYQGLYDALGEGTFRSAFSRLNLSLRYKSLVSAFVGMEGAPATSAPLS